MISESELRQRGMAMDRPEDAAVDAPLAGAAEEVEEGGKLSRRNFLRLGVGALGVLTALEVGGTAVLFLRGADNGKAAGGIFEAGPMEQFPPSSVTEFRAAGFFLVRAPEGGFLAVHRRCPHLGCTVEWVEERERFYCPCHGSSFDFYGGMENPPVPRPLDTFAVFIEEGLVKVDTTRTLKRESFRPDQLAFDPDGHGATAEGAEGVGSPAGAPGETAPLHLNIRQGAGG
jgi:cytochrome b6-f complex iron-sulfur subunit